MTHRTAMIIQTSVLLATLPFALLTLWRQARQTWRGQ